MLEQQEIKCANQKSINGVRGRGIYITEMLWDLLFVSTITRTEITTVSLRSYINK